MMINNTIHKKFFIIIGIVAVFALFNAEFIFCAQSGYEASRQRYFEMMDAAGQGEIPEDELPPEFDDMPPDEFFDEFPPFDDEPPPDFTDEPPEERQGMLESFKTSKSSDNKKIILDVLELKDMDIRDVLKLISRKTDMSIVVGNNVKGRVSIFMREVEVMDALRIILESNNLAFVKDLGIIRIMPDKEFERLYGHKFGRKVKSTVISLKGMKATDAVGLLNQIKTPAGRVIGDEQSNTVMIEDTEDRIKEMEEYVSKIDQETSSVAIVLKYVQAEALMAKIEPLLTPKLGSIQFDTRSNKLFIKDTQSKVEEIEHFVKEIDIRPMTKMFDISYGSAEDISKMIEQVLTEGLGHVEFDNRSNKVIVTDTKSKIVQVQKMILQLDRKEKEVLIEAKIIQIGLNDSFRMGVDWDSVLKDSHDLKFTSALGGIGADFTKKGTFSLGTLDKDNYNLVIDALDTFGKTKILSSPRIAVVNNEEAKILVGTTKPYVTTTTTTPSSGAPTTAEAVNFIDVGVKLYVTPVIHNDGFITMKIKPEVSTATDSYTTGQGNFIPIVETSEVETTIRVKDGVTIVMGGLIKDERTEDDTKIPMLGDIPVVGHAFRNQSKTVAKTEVVIFLTPHIISGDIHTKKAKKMLNDQFDNSKY